MKFILSSLTTLIIFIVVSGSYLNLFPFEETVTKEAESTLYLPLVIKPSIFYISKSGNNTSGRSWENAWNEFDQIDWDILIPGSLILIDGGSSEMIYETNLIIEKSGLINRPIIFRRTDEVGRNGNVIIFGGRKEKLPHCFQANVDLIEQAELPLYGINTNDHSHIIIDGRDWNGIQIHGFGRSGVILEHESINVMLRNIEIFNNGEILENEDGIYTDRPGLILGGKNHSLEFLNIHDNGQDAIQSIWHDSKIENFTLRYSWLHNERRHPKLPTESFNYCTHSDGIQIFSGGIVDGVTIDKSFIGPGLTNNLLLGSPNGANVHNVLISNSVISKPAEHGLRSHETDAENFHIDHVTFDCWDTKWTCLQIYGDDSHSVTNSIVYGAEINFYGGIGFYSGNCIWQTSGTHGNQIGLQTDPLFTNFDFDRFGIVNYQMANQSPCASAGSSLKSVDQLKELSSN